jgi:hypothetical protein
MGKIWSFLQSHNSIGLVVSNKKIFKISTNQNTLWALAAMLDFRSVPKTQILYMTIQWTFLPSLVFFLKPQNRFESNLAEMFIVWSYTRFVFLVLIGNPTWLPGKFRPIRTHYGPWQPCWISDQRQKHKSCIWPSNEHFCQIWFKSVPLSQLNCDFAGMIIGWSCTKLVNRLPIGNSRWPPWLDLV